MPSEEIVRIEVGGDGIVTHTHYAVGFSELAKSLGGRWNPKDKTWTFREATLEAVEAMLLTVYGTTSYPPAQPYPGIITVAHREFQAPYKWGSHTAWRVSPASQNRCPNRICGPSLHIGNNGYLILPAGSQYWWPDLPPAIADQMEDHYGSVCSFIVDKEP